MPDLLEVLQTIKGTGTQLNLHTQGLDTTTPSGRALYQMLGVFSELEREMHAYALPQIGDGSVVLAPT